jgi:hypothetical protein
MSAPGQTKTGLPYVLFQATRPSFEETRGFPTPHFYGCGFSLKKIVIEARNPTATGPPRPFTFQPQAALLINAKAPASTKKCD